MFYVWLLSIIDKIECLFPLGIIFGCITSFVFLIARVGERELHKDPTPTIVAKHMKPVMIICAIIAIIGALVPSRRDLVESYLMIHGSKVVTAENAEKAIDGTVKRIDKLIEKIGQK